MFTFSAFNRKHTFWANFAKTLKIVVLTWNVVPRLIQICRVQDSVQFFCFRQEMPFLGKFGQNIKFISLGWKLVPRLI